VVFFIHSVGHGETRRDVERKVLYEAKTRPHEEEHTGEQRRRTGAVVVTSLSGGMGNGGDTAAVTTTRGEVGGGGNGKARWQVGLSRDGKRGDIKYYLFLALFSFVPSRQDAVGRGEMR
jgi:hypothetical protein